MRPESRSSPRRVEAELQRKRALELRKAGASFAKIASALGYASESGARRAVNSALDRLVRASTETVDELRRLDLERLDEMLVSMWPKAKNGDAYAVDRVLRIMERRSKLIGLDAPERLEHTGRGGGPIETIDRSHLSRLRPEQLEALESALDQQRKVMAELEETVH